MKGKGSKLWVCLIVVSLVLSTMIASAATIQDTSGYCDIVAKDTSNSCDAYYCCTDDGDPVLHNLTRILNWSSGDSLQIKAFINMSVGVSGSHSYSMDAYLTVHEHQGEEIGHDELHWTGVTADRSGNLVVNVPNITEDILMDCELEVYSTPEWAGPGQASDTTYYGYEIELEP